jgi:hypothetical protein
MLQVEAIMIPRYLPGLPPIQTRHMYNDLTSYDRSERSCFGKGAGLKPAMLPVGLLVSARIYKRWTLISVL